MRTTIDKAGRVVIPAAIRAKAGPPAGRGDRRARRGGVDPPGARGSSVEAGARGEATGGPADGGFPGACRRSTSQRSSRKSAIDGRRRPRLDTSVLVAGLRRWGRRRSDRRRSRPGSRAGQLRRSQTAGTARGVLPVATPTCRPGSLALRASRAPARRSRSDGSVAPCTTRTSREIARLSGAKVVVTDNRRHFLSLAAPRYPRAGPTSSDDLVRAQRPATIAAGGCGGARYSRVTSPAAAADSQARRGICVASLPPLTSTSAPVM